MWLEDNNVAIDADVTHTDYERDVNGARTTGGGNGLFESSEIDELPRIPTARRSCEMDLRSAANLIGSHVMFNKHGPLLVRQRKNASFTIAKSLVTENCCEK